MPARLLIHGPDSRFANMATDEALLLLVNDPVLRCYEWSEPDAVSIGYFQSIAEVPDGRPFVRRYTGGGLVDHREDFTYSVIVPRGHPLDARGSSSSYADIHEAVTRALREQGWMAEIAPESDPQHHAACFQRAVKYDVIDDRARKLAGAAQRRSRSGTLHQGSIVPPGPFDRLSLRQSLIHCLMPLLAESWSESNLTEAESDTADQLNSSRYCTDAWNRQR